MEYDLINAQSYIPSFEILFKKYPIKRVLEFGEGNGTQFLLDNSDFVCSIEVVAHKGHQDWANRCFSYYSGYAVSKWKQVTIKCSEKVIEADRARQKNDQLDSSSFIGDLSGYIEKAFEYGPFDMAFVDYGIHMRGDLVNLLFGKVSIIAAHDTNVSASIYGWNKISIPDSYKEYKFHNEYLGTTFWIKE